MVQQPILHPVTGILPNGIIRVLQRLTLTVLLVLVLVQDHQAFGGLIQICSLLDTLGKRARIMELNVIS
jgi:hypothetical protein